MEGQLYDDYRQMPQAKWPWHNFKPEEIACPCCQAILVVPETMDRLQAARILFGEPIRIASGYRCPVHNARVSNTGKDGPHTTGTAFDPYPVHFDAGSLARMEDAFFKMEPLGRGKGLVNNSLHLHFDWSQSHGRRSWGY